MRRRRFLLLLLDRDRVRFLGMSLAGLLLIGLTASAERGAAVMGLAYVLGAPQPAAISSPAPVNVIEVSAPSCRRRQRLPRPRRPRRRVHRALRPSSCRRRPPRPPAPRRRQAPRRPQAPRRRQAPRPHRPPHR